MRPTRYKRDSLLFPPTRTVPLAFDRRVHVIGVPERIQHVIAVAPAEAAPPGGATPPHGRLFGPRVAPDQPHHRGVGMRAHLSVILLLGVGELDGVRPAGLVLLPVVLGGGVICAGQGTVRKARGDVTAVQAAVRS